MKKLLLVTTLFITALSLNAQTFTYTGNGNWTDQANWSPSYPGDNGLENPNYIFNINGDCTFTNFIFSIQAQLNISGTLELSNGTLNRISNNVYLDNGTLSVGDDTSFLNNTVFGSGVLSAFFSIRLLDVIINPGETSSGTITIQGFSSIDDVQFIFDIYSTTDFDTVADFSTGNSNGTNSVSINLVNSTPINSNSSFALFTNVNNNLFNALTNPSIINGFQPQLTYSPTTGSRGNIILTFADIEAPTITNCPTVNVNADCGTFFTIPDYTTTTTATDNDTATTITYTQSLPAGLGAVNGTEITITATDSAGNSSDCTFTLNVTETAVLRVLDFDDVGKHITLYPNPSNGLFTIKNTSGLLLETGQIIDAKGALVKTVNLSSYSEEKTVNLGSLSTGVYLFKILTPDGYVIKKVLIE